MRLKKRFLLYFVLLGMALTLMIRSRNMGQEIPVSRDYPEIAEEGILRLVTEYNRTGYYISGDTIEGFHYELSQAISDISGLEVRIQLEMSLSESFLALADHQTDIVARNIPVTSQNREEYLFTDPIIFNKQVLVQRTAAANDGIEPIRNQLELGGKTIYIPKDSPALLRLSNLAEEIGDTIRIIEEDLYSTEQLLILVAKGEIDLAVCEQQTSLKYLDQLPELDILTDISFTQLEAWAVRKESPILLDSLNHWLQEIKEQGIYEKIYRRYYENRPPPTR